jgi:penicillin-binding protein 1C
VEQRASRAERARRPLSTVLCAVIALIAIFPLVDWLFPFPEARLHKAPAMLVLDRNGDPLRIYLPPDEKYRLPVTLAELPPELERALIASEDRSFYRHPGVNPFAVARATWTNLRARRVVSGASTIPMQIARMSDRRPRRITAKLLETFRAMQLTVHHSKRELLEIYVNLVPYGANIEGVGAASWCYFGKPASRLSLGEIALLTTLPRAPNRYDPLREADRARRARDLVLDQLVARHAFTQREIAEAKRQPLPRVRRKPPFAAPHFCDLAVKRAGGPPERSDGQNPHFQIETTLDPRMQKLAEERLAARVRGLRVVGVENAAAVVIDNKTREVRALVGSAGFFERQFDGHVNGATARRSPGSTLKPFLYARAFDRGTLVPDSYLFDIPTDFSGYVPENYDGNYRRRVTVREALVQSLNAPAVRLLADDGIDDFLAVLRRGGLRTLDRSAGEYGLPLILGSGEVSLLDLTNLYATLANGGEYEPATLFPRTASRPPRSRLFSREASALVTEIMCELKRPDLPQSWELTVDTPRIAWKTGTSYGHRDAWSVGFSSRYTIGIWVGNFDGHGQKGISGSEHAAPLLFDLFRVIEGGGVIHVPEVGIESVEVCALSHELPGPYCPSRVRIRQIAGRTRLPMCNYHQQIIVDAISGERLHGDCVGARPSVMRTVVVDPPEYVSYRRAQNQPVAQLPPLSRACGDVDDAQRPRIASPDSSTPYRIRRDAPVEYQEILLSAHAPSDVRRLFWYVDGTLVAAAPPARANFIPPRRGRHRLTVVDDAGRSDEVTFEVR